MLISNIKRMLSAPNEYSNTRFDTVMLPQHEMKCNRLACLLEEAGECAPQGSSQADYFYMGSIGVPQQGANLHITPFVLHVTALSSISHDGGEVRFLLCEASAPPFYKP